MLSGATGPRGRLAGERGPDGPARVRAGRDVVGRVARRDAVAAVAAAEVRDEDGEGRLAERAREKLVRERAGRDVAERARLGRRRLVRRDVGRAPPTRARGRVAEEVVGA